MTRKFVRFIEKMLDSYLDFVLKCPKFMQLYMTYAIVFPLWCCVKFFDKLDKTSDIDPWCEVKESLVEEHNERCIKESKLSKALE